MQPVPEHRTILSWIRPSMAERYEIYSESGVPQAVLTIGGRDHALLESRFGTYRIQRQTQFTPIAVTDATGSPIATIRSGWWKRLYLRFDDGREFRFTSSTLFRSRWIWSSTDGEPRAIVQHSRIFFSPDWPVRQGLSALLAGLTIYFIVTRPSFLQGLWFR